MMMDMDNELFIASFISGARRAESLSLDGAMRQLAHMISMPHTELHAEQCLYDGQPLDVWFVYAPGWCVGTIRTASLV